MKSIIKKQKGQLGNLQGIVLSLIIVGILIGAAFFILGEFHDQIQEILDGQSNTTAALGVNKTINALDTVPDLLPLIILIAMIVIILFLVFTIPGARSQA